MVASTQHRDEQPELVSLEGVVERITFHNESNGFTIIKLKVANQKHPVAVVACTPAIKIGEQLTCTGHWEHDRKHGLQFQAQTCQPAVPTTLSGIEKYLASGMIKGIGAHFAKRLIKHFGDDVLDVIAHHPDKLLALPGIGPKRVEAIQSAWASHRHIHDIMIFLQSHGLGHVRAYRIYKAYGQQALSVVQHNPYRLAYDIQGFGFKLADQLAQNLGIDPKDERRIQAALWYVINQLSTQGHTAVTMDMLFPLLHELVQCDETSCTEALDILLHDERIVLSSYEDRSWYQTPKLAEAEQTLCKRVVQLQQAPLPWQKKSALQALESLLNSQKQRLSEAQVAAVEVCLAHKVAILTGGPGVGKTTVVRAMIKTLQAQKVRMVLAAPTGRAAKRLSESTNMPAKTIHRLLSFQPENNQFQFHRDNPLPHDLIIIDEASMLDTVMARHLLCAISDRTAIWLIGDIDQLPSVGPGQVLADLIASKACAVARLTEVYRQAKGSRIITNAHRINEGAMPFYNRDDPESDFYVINCPETEAINRTVIKLVTDRIPARFGLDPVQDIQLLTPMHRGPVGSRSLNALMQRTLNGETSAFVERLGMRYAVGDKVIQLSNNYDKSVFNGDQGIITSIDHEEKLLTVDFDNQLVGYDLAEIDELGLAYALSIHKSQGSEYPAVIVVLTTHSYTLLARNLIYTAVTRARKLLVIVGQSRALAMAVNNHTDMQRQTLLRHGLHLLASPQPPGTSSDSAET